ncbi:hypothetical protein HPB48_009388 [Haemaphysalis longicornis]|uniref:Orn/DAP/Arg decarboxylase 2 N-terminal domain-containing protein n=1 Tax=Haemaphysalis longicornis TaxID=44386 RepID=A0A9J6GY71_HAELO|nr:hypothetical protein HPB48_009388 [Haemaphysalis longicornis]
MVLLLSQAVKMEYGVGNSTIHTDGTVVDVARRVIDSQREIATMLDMGTKAERILYAQTVKNCSHLDYAEEVGVNIMTFDAPEELEKIHQKNASPLDCIAEKQRFFDVDPDEWLVVDNMGAYSIVNACGFNGFGFPRVHYICEPNTADEVRAVLNTLPVEGGYGAATEIIKKRPTDDALKKKAQMQNGHGDAHCKEDLLRHQLQNVA